MNKSRLFLSLVCLLSAMLVLSACAKNTGTQDTPKGTDEASPTLNTTEPTATPNIKLNEMEYTEKGAVLPAYRAFVSDRSIFVEYALPGESKPFFNYDVKLRIFETSYEDIECTYDGMQIAVELKSLEDNSIKYLKSGFIPCSVEENYSYAYLAMVHNLTGNDEDMFFVTLIPADSFPETYVFTLRGEKSIFSGSPYEFGKSLLIMRTAIDCIGYKSILIENDVYYTPIDESVTLLERRTPANILYTEEGYPEKVDESDSVPYHIVLQEFEAYIKTNNRNHIKGKINAGVKLKITATDRMGKVYFETNTGEAGYFTLTYDKVNNKVLVAGIPQEEVFDNIFYP